MAMEAMASLGEMGNCLQVYYIMLIVDSAVINIFIVLSIHIFIKRLNHLYYSRLKMEYWIMFSCSVCRIVIDCVFVGYNSIVNERLCVSEKEVNSV